MDLIILPVVRSVCLLGGGACGKGKGGTCHTGFGAFLLFWFANARAVTPTFLTGHFVRHVLTLGGHLTHVWILTSEPTVILIPAGVCSCLTVLNTVCACICYVGASSDLETATKIARLMVTKFGMTETVSENDMHAELACHKIACFTIS